MGFTSREECTPETVKAARRKMALAVHPDKVGHDHPGANLAAGRVNKVCLYAFVCMHLLVCFCLDGVVCSV